MGHHSHDGRQDIESFGAKKSDQLQREAEIDLAAFRQIVNADPFGLDLIHQAHQFALVGGIVGQRLGHEIMLEELQDAFSQTRKYAQNAAQARGLNMDW